MVSIWPADGRQDWRAKCSQTTRSLAALKRPAPGDPLAQGVLKAALPGFPTIGKNSRWCGPTVLQFSELNTAGPEVDHTGEACRSLPPKSADILCAGRWGCR